MCYNFKLKCEKSDEILLNKAENFSECPDEMKGFVKFMPLTCLEIERDDNTTLNDAAIKVEQESSFSDDDDKDDVLSLAEKFGVKSICKKSKESSDKKQKIKDKKGSDDKQYEGLNSGEVIRKYKSKRGRKRIKPKQEENQLTEDGFKKVYECPKCLYFCKSFNFLSKHFDKYHQIVLKDHQHYEEIIDNVKKRDKSLNRLEESVDDNYKLERKLRTCDKETIGNLLDVKICSEELNVLEESDVIKERNDNILSLTDKMLLYKCLECDYTNRKYSKVKLHILKHKEDKYIQCQDCEFRCSNVIQLRGHVCLYSDNTTLHPFQCQLCGHTTTSRTLLRTHHASIHSEERPFACHVCNFTTKLKSGLYQHIQRRHEKRKNFSCPVCDKKFFTSYHMKIHALTHGGNKQHVCDYCGSSFIQKSNLMKHVDAVHSAERVKRPYACSWCTYKSRTPQTLAKHVMTHTGQKPNACHLCPFKCISSSVLKLHILRHKGEKKYSCSTCSYKCYSKDRLKDHERVHSGERPFVCEQCPYRAKTKERLKYHVVSHRNEQKYFCDKCPYTANYRSNLRKHIQKSCGRSGRKYSSAGSHITNLQHDIPSIQQDTEIPVDIVLLQQNNKESQAKME